MSNPVNKKDTNTANGGKQEDEQKPTSTPDAVNGGIDEIKTELTSENKLLVEKTVAALSVVLLNEIQAKLDDLKNEIISECKPNLGATIHRVAEVENKVYIPKKKSNNPKK